MPKIKRKALSKKTREAVYNKYNGHCAYCGCSLELKDMQVDHFKPFRNIAHKVNTLEEIECFENYFPVCRMCNYYKRSKNIETFRRELHKINSRLQKTFLYRLALKYNLIEEKPHKIIFYFERETDGHTI